MTMENIVREVCAAIPLCCRCGAPFRPDRIDLVGSSRKSWHVYATCGRCDEIFQISVDLEHPSVSKACFTILGERTLEEEVRLLAEPEIPLNYKGQLPVLFGNLWTAGPKEEPPLRLA